MACTAPQATHLAHLGEQILIQLIRLILQRLGRALGYLSKRVIMADFLQGKRDESHPVDVSLLDLAGAFVDIFLNRCGRVVLEAGDQLAGYASAPRNSLVDKR
jgi:hypothetical protein